MGYAKNVCKDEIQAYFSTGLYKDLKYAKPYTKEFIKTFKKLNNE